MRYSNKTALFAIVFLFSAISACKKNTNGTGEVTPVPVQPPLEAGVYVVGNTAASNLVSPKATIWKDGVMSYVTIQQSSADAIALNGKDMYVAGSITPDNENGVACYWKNNVLVKLGSGNNYYSEAKDIVVSGNDVYAAGNVNRIPGQQVAVYWKNGVMETLSTEAQKATARGIAVIGNDVYVCGFYTVASGSFSMACYWKNGVRKDLGPDIYTSSAAYGIAVNGNDVYIAGSAANPNDANSMQSAIVWKNGQESFLTNPTGARFTYAASVAIVNGQLYFTGSTLMANDYQAAYWTPGGTVRLMPGASFGDAIAVKGSDVYVAGSRRSLTNIQLTEVMLWKNEQVQLNFPAHSELRDVVIVP